jgi:hypothetical protein
MLTFVVGTWKILVSISSLQGADMLMTDLGRVMCDDTGCSTAEIVLD